jgi:polyribonucleotide nucleotidyltransferase
MTAQNFAQHWALLVAGVIGVVVLAFVLVRLVQDSARGRLAAAVGQLRDRESTARKVARRASKAETKLESLKARADSVKPRTMEVAAGRLQDAEALKKIADDKVRIARNVVRQIILAEFPPKRQAAMRQRLLPDEHGSDKPFTMGA